MKKLLVLFAILALTLTSLNAQGKTVKFDVAGELALPTGNFGNVAGIGFGLSGKAYYPFNEKMDFTMLLGYTYFTGEENAYYEYNYSALPILFGVKYDLSNVTPGFYASGELGITVLMFSMEYTGPANSYLDGYDYSSSDSEFTLGLSAGYGINNFDLSASYRLVSNANQFVLRVGYYLPTTMSL